MLVACLAAVYIIWGTTFFGIKVAIAGEWLGHERFSPQLLLGLPIVLGAVALHAWVQTHPASARLPQPAGALLGAEELD